MDLNLGQQTVDVATTIQALVRGKKILILHKHISKINIKEAYELKDPVRTKADKSILKL